MGVTGGDKFFKFIKDAKKAQRKIIGKPMVISVGFLDKIIAVLAAQLEFGNPNTKLPERPAFRQAIERIKRELAPFIIKNKLINPRFMIVDDNAAHKIAEWLVNKVKESYHGLDEPAEGERQLARKGGQSDPLVGTSGPKLIEHIAAEINGLRVD